MKPLITLKARVRSCYWQEATIAPNDVVQWRISPTQISGEISQLRRRVDRNLCKHTTRMVDERMVDVRSFNRSEGFWFFCERGRLLFGHDTGLDWKPVCLFPVLKAVAIHGYVVFIWLGLGRSNEGFSTIRQKNLLIIFSPHTWHWETLTKPRPFSFHSLTPCLVPCGNSPCALLRGPGRGRGLRTKRGAPVPNSMFSPSACLFC